MKRRRLTDTEAEFARLITKARRGDLITQTQRVAVYRMIKESGLEAAQFALIRAIDTNKARNL